VSEYDSVTLALTRPKEYQNCAKARGHAPRAALADEEGTSQRIISSRL